MVKKKSHKVTKKYDEEGVFAILASILVVFSAMIDPIFSVVLSFGLLLGYGIYRIIKKRK